MNEADKERFKREKDLYDRGIPGGGEVGVAVNTVRLTAPAPAQSAEAEPLCDDMKRKMNALLHADTFSCERLPEDVAGRFLVTIVSTFKICTLW